MTLPLTSVTLTFIIVFIIGVDLISICKQKHVRGNNKQTNRYVYVYILYIYVCVCLLYQTINVNQTM